MNHRKISNIIEELKKLKDKFGDLPVGIGMCNSSHEKTVFLIKCVHPESYITEYNFVDPEYTDANESNLIAYINRHPLPDLHDA